MAFPFHQIVKRGACRRHPARIFHRPERRSRRLRLRPYYAGSQIAEALYLIPTARNEPTATISNIDEKSPEAVVLQLVEPLRIFKQIAAAKGNDGANLREQEISTMLKTTNQTGLFFGMQTVLVVASVKISATSSGRLAAMSDTNTTPTTQDLLTQCVNDLAQEIGQLNPGDPLWPERVEELHILREIIATFKTERNQKSSVSEWIHLQPSWAG